MRLLSSNQQEAIEKLQRLKVGALFMGCGTGKTQTAITLINGTNDVDLVLWVAPLRTINSLKEEVALCNSRYDITFYGVESIGQSDRIFLEVLELVKSYERVFIVVDESLKIKNLKAKRTKRLIKIGNECEYKLILNGTPVTKNILDIYAQMTFLSPRILQRNFYQFRDDYCMYWQKKVNGVVKETHITGFANVVHLLNLIEPYVYECSLDLPLTKHYTVVYWRMTEEEKAEYEGLKALLIEFAEDKDHSVLGLLQKLQHSYCLAKEKVECLKGRIDENTIIFCKFKQSEEFLKKLYPDTKILTYGKNSFGLNLQNYSKIIYFDKTFDYAFREQSEARIYRTGQQNNCEYIDLTGDLGLERLIDSCIAKKIGLVEAFKLKGNNLKEL